MLLRRLAVPAALACLVLASALAGDEIGSWYGLGVHGRLTTNGEHWPGRALR